MTTPQGVQLQLPDPLNHMHVQSGILADVPAQQNRQLQVTFSECKRLLISVRHASSREQVAMR